MSRALLSGWGGQPRLPARRLLVRNDAELDAAVAMGPLAVRGLGRAYGDAALSDNGYVLDMTAYAGVTSFDTAAGVVSCRAGTSLRDLIAAVLPHGWFPAVVPGTQEVTVGGAIAADVHGKNHHRAGGFGAHVLDLELLCADGTRRRLSPSLHPSWFWATVSGMGLTGVITAARLQLRRVATAWIVARTVRAFSLDGVLDAVAAADRTASASVAWIDVRPTAPLRGVVTSGAHAPLAALPAARHATALAQPLRRPIELALTPPFCAVRATAVAAFNRAYFGAQRNGERLVPYDRYFFPLDRVADWNRLYGRRGFLQYQCVVPDPGAADAIAAIVATVRARRVWSALAVLKRLGVASPAPLGFAMPGLTLALDFPAVPELADLLERLDAIVLAASGRVYLAKDSRLDAATFRAMTPRLDEWRALKRTLDPHNRWRSALAERLGLLA